ncbi:MAG TPA: flagellar basal body L-ring protein FlgH [Vicinamibacterales bacterium]|nr:flagellar basal body L-ring protein FlgH [Vicinamibacterales bacterium]
MTRAFLLTAAIIALSSAIVSGQKPKAAESDKKIKADNYDAVVARYLETARLQASATPADPNAWVNGLMGDRRARQVNDLVTVRVIESISASGSAGSDLSKKGSATAGLGGLFGIESKLPSSIRPENLVGIDSETGYQGGGSTSRAGELSAIITARVAEVLPNGDLVLEGIREVDINGDRQIIVLTGTARSQDVGPGNVLLSPSIGQLRIRYFGKGLMKDSMSPGWLIRIINKIF